MKTRRPILVAHGLLTSWLSRLASPIPRPPRASSSERGNQQVAQQQFPEAIIEYRRAIQADPRLGEARLKLAHAYASAGDGPERAARVRARGRPDAGRQRHAGQGRHLHAAGRALPGRAGRWPRGCWRATPNNVDAQILLANSLAGLKDMDRRRRGVREGRRDGPRPLGDLFRARLGAARQRRYGRRGSAHSRRPSRSIRSPPTRISRSPTSNGPSARWTRRKPKSGAPSRSTRAARSPTAPWRCCISSPTSPQAAEPHLKMVAEVTQLDGAKYFLAEYYLRLGRIDDARATLTPLLAKDESFVAASIRLARVEVVGKRTPRPTACSKPCWRANPRTPRRSITQGRLRLSEGNTISALTALQTAVEANPQVGRGSAGAGRDLCGARRHRGSDHGLQRCLKLDAKSHGRAARPRPAA